MKKIFIFYSLLSFFLSSNAPIFAHVSSLKQSQKSIELSFQDLPQGGFTNEAQELDTDSYESKSDKSAVIVISIIAGLAAIGGVVVPLVLLK